MAGLGGGLQFLVWEVCDPSASRHHECRSAAAEASSCPVGASWEALVTTTGFASKFWSDGTPSFCLP
eukprot:2111017-Pyramimonas_sp.AAC.1